MITYTVPESHTSHRSQGIQTPFSSSRSHSDHIHEDSHIFWANTDLHTCEETITPIRSHPSAMLPGGPERGGGRAGDFYACLYLMNHMQIRWRTSYRRVSPQRLWEEGHKDWPFWAESPEQVSGLRGPETGCAHPHQGAGSRRQDQLQRLCCCGGRDPSVRG